MEFLKIIPGLGHKEGELKARHVAITTEGVPQWATAHKIALDDAYKVFNAQVQETIKTQIKLNIPVLTLYALRSDMQDLKHFSARVDALTALFTELAQFPLVHEQRIKLSVFGKWYDLPARIVEPIKAMAESTKDYDRFFVNFCVYYDGQEEIVDACKILSMQVKTEKLDVNAIGKKQIKENIYTSDFLPPDLIIKNGLFQQLNGLLLWDSVTSHVYFTKKLWPEFTKADFERAVHDFESKKI